MIDKKSNIENKHDISDSTDNTIEVSFDETTEDFVFTPTSIDDVDLEKYKPYTVYIPKEYIDHKFIGNLYGIYIEETKTFNVLPSILRERYKDEIPGLRYIGTVYHKDCVISQDFVTKDLCKDAFTPFLFCIWDDNNLKIHVTCNVFFVNFESSTYNQSCNDVTLKTYSLRSEIFSRNQGILEESQMQNKQALIGGLGSGGAIVAIELAKTGIGSIILCDDDTLDYGNICRHICGIKDIGRYKVDAVAERIYDINPFCEVYKFRDTVQNINPERLKDVLWENSIILCCSDNRHAAYICNSIADEYKIPMVDAGCGPRASTGEIFYYKPDMPSYECAYGEDRGLDHSNKEIRRRFYTTESELEKMNFQPGMHLDIQQTAIFQTKVAIDLLMEDEEGYEPKILPYIKQLTVLFNFKVDSEVNEYMKLFPQNSKPIQWKSFDVKK